jgi:hypothetical protein
VTYWRVMGSTFERRRNRLDRSQAEIVGLLSDTWRVERGADFLYRMVLARDASH